MLFAVTWTERGASEEGQKRLLQLFTNWKPPAGLEFKGFYDFADGSGGIAIVEAPSAAAVLEATGPFTPYLEFRAVPIVDSYEAVPIFQRVNAWRDSLR